MLAFAFAEGTGNDWISVALIDGYGAPAAVGTLGFAAFLTAMTAGRWFGPGAARPLRARAGAPRAGASSALVGLGLFVFSRRDRRSPSSAPLLWGVGAVPRLPGRA